MATAWELTGSSVLVTGGSGGLGAAAVRAFHAAGAAVVIADVAEQPSKKLAEELGERAVYARTDVTDSASVEAALATASGLGVLRTVVVAHGGWGVAERIVDRGGKPAPLENFEKTISLYLVGTYNVLRLGAAAMAGNEPVGPDGARGAVVTTASIAAYEGQIGQAPYAAAKGAVVSLTLAAARDLAPVGVRVCCIAPGTMRTPMMETVGPEALAKFEAAVPFPSRLGDPGEYGSLAVHLATNGYLNGETIRLDGAQRLSPR
jgi:NAD(P)-dependent dehydrogenase (short-subunit alcohol dehydrogenase family)